MIRNHFFEGAVDTPSPNFSNREITPRFVVMHYTAGWNAQSAINHFANPASQVSAQFTIETDGTVYQHVACNRRAWHAGPSSYGGYSDLNSHSVGIEFVNPGWLRKLADGSYQDWTGSRVPASRVPHAVAAENARVGSGKFYWPLFTRAQLDAGEAVTRSLIAAYPILDIVTHEEIDQRGWKTDPGPAFPMNRFKALLRDRQTAVARFEVTADFLNARTGPGSQYQIRRELPTGTQVSELARDGSWVRISSDEWVHGGFLRRIA